MGVCRRTAVSPLRWCRFILTGAQKMTRRSTRIWYWAFCLGGVVKVCRRPWRVWCRRSRRVYGIWLVGIKWVISVDNLPSRIQRICRPFSRECDDWLSLARHESWSCYHCLRKMICGNEEELRTHTRISWTRYNITTNCAKSDFVQHVKDHLFTLESLIIEGYAMIKGFDLESEVSACLDIRRGVSIIDKRLVSRNQMLRLILGMNPPDVTVRLLGENCRWWWYFNEHWRWYLGDLLALSCKI